MTIRSLVFATIVVCGMVVTGVTLSCAAESPKELQTA